MLNLFIKVVIKKKYLYRKYDYEGGCCVSKYEVLVKKAVEARLKAYAPYSGFRVGAALLDKNDNIYTGCNIENVSFSPTCCAERVAIFKAVSEGVKEFEAIAIASDSNDYTYPCGVCRQVISEFKILNIIVSDREGNYKIHKLSQILPYAFTEYESEEE